MSLIIWITLPFKTGIINFDLGILFFLCCIRLRVYPIISAGWSSNSKYPLLGRLRSVAQTISYEVSLAIILLSIIFITESFNPEKFSIYQETTWLIWLTFPLSYLWLASCLAETNRTPFDFSESESELVSGFNTEYRRGIFAIIFIAEYARILFMRALFVVIFIGGNIHSLIFPLKLTFLVFVFIWIRGTLPRLRYDKLIHLAWKRFLPVSLNYLIFFIAFKILCFCLLI